MRAHTITKLLTTKNINTNVPEVLARFDYNIAIREAEQFLKAGDKKKAFETFKDILAWEKLKVEDLQVAASQQILVDLAMAA